MLVALIRAEFEQNLAVRYLGSVLLTASVLVASGCKQEAPRQRCEKAAQPVEPPKKPDVASGQRLYFPKMPPQFARKTQPVPRKAPPQHTQMALPRQNPPRPALTPPVSLGEPSQRTELAPPRMEPPIPLNAAIIRGQVRNALLPMAIRGLRSPEPVFVKLRLRQNGTVQSCLAGREGEEPRKLNAAGVVFEQKGVGGKQYLFRFAKGEVRKAMEKAGLLKPVRQSATEKPDRPEGDPQWIRAQAFAWVLPPIVAGWPRASEVTVHVSLDDSGAVERCWYERAGESSRQCTGIEGMELLQRQAAGKTYHLVFSEDEVNTFWQRSHGLPHVSSKRPQ